jgi:hypothetical protein
MAPQHARIGPSLAAIKIVVTVYRVSVTGPWCDTLRALRDISSEPTVPNVIAITATIATACIKPEAGLPSSNAAVNRARN